ncbi:Hypothetical predicted protein, partial [Lynx pardinus]
TNHGEDEGGGDTDSVDEAGCNESQGEAEKNPKEGLCLESGAKDKILQATEGSEREDEETRAQQPPLDVEPLCRG